MRARSAMFIALVLYIFLHSAAAMGQEYLYDGTIIDQPNIYDGYPTHLYLDGTHHMWFCALSKSTSNWADGIFY